MSKLINRGRNQCSAREGLALRYNRGTGFGLAEREEWTNPRERGSLNKGNEVGGAGGIHTGFGGE